jgi:Protein of unknown function (DUF3108).
MTRRNSRLILLVPAFLIFFTYVYAQPPKPRAEPLTVGETLTYEGKLSKSILRGISVADLSFKVVKSSDNRGYLIKTEARSKGTLTKWFGFTFQQIFESSVEAENFRILKTVKHDEQGDRVRNSEAVFDYDDKRVTYVETDPNDPMRPPRRIASQIEDETHDLVSAIYSLRLLPLTVGKTFYVMVSDSGLVYKVPVHVAARERQNSVLGKVWCFRLEPEVFGANRIINQEGKMTIWITDDERRLPIRSRIDSSIGKVEVKLKKIETQ